MDMGVQGQGGRDAEVNIKDGQKGTYRGVELGSISALLGSFLGHVKVSRDGSSPKRNQRHNRDPFFLSNPFAKNNGYCMAVLLKWNGHLFHL